MLFDYAVHRNQTGEKLINSVLRRQTMETSIGIVMHVFDKWRKPILICYLDYSLFLIDNTKLSSIFSTNIFIVSILIRFPPWYLDWMNFSMLLNLKLYLTVCFITIVTFLGFVACRPLFRFLPSLTLTIYKNVNTNSISIICLIEPRFFLLFFLFTKFFPLSFSLRNTLPRSGIIVLLDVKSSKKY